MVLNKRTVIVAASLAALPLTAVLIAAAIHRGRPKSLQTKEFLGQARSKADVITTATATYKQQQDEKSQGRTQLPWQGSETKASTTAAKMTTIATSTTIADKDVTTPAAVPSPMVPSSTSDSAVIVPSSQTSKEEEISVSDEAMKAGESLKELIVTAIKEAKDSAKETGKRLKEQKTINIATITVDSKDIHSLEDNVNAAVSLFEETMVEIRKESYDAQIKLLDSYKELLRTHIKVINARSRMASKLKPGS
jgi:DNA-binding protein YbaB